MPYLRQLPSRHDSGQALRNVCYGGVTYKIVVIRTFWNPNRFNFIRIL